MPISSAQNYWECPKCHKTFPNLYDLNYHAIQKHQQPFPIDQIIHHKPEHVSKQKVNNKMQLKVKPRNASR